MTPNFKEFKEFVEDKFGSITRFAKITTGSYHTYKGLQNLPKSDDNYWRIHNLKCLAKKTKFDRGKVEIMRDKTEKPCTMFGIRISFIIIHKEYFKLKWLLRYGFWRIIWFGIVAKFGYTTVNKNPINSIYISYGTAKPLEELFDKGYRTRLIGKIFNEPILEYRLN